MNIDIVNKQVADKLKLKESKVRLINQFYWQQIYQHLYSYDPLPVNIENVCVFYPHKKRIKETILLYVKKLRKIKTSKKFRPNSPTHQKYILLYTTYLKHFWALRKYHKFTN